MPRYTTPEQIEATLQRVLDEKEQENIEDIIEAVGASIDAYTGRSWNDYGEGNPDSETRLYDGTGSRELFIDDYVSVTTLRLLDTFGNTIETIAASDFLQYPLNTPWKNSIYLRWRRFPYTRAGVQVTGVFTTGNVPAEVQLAAASMAGLVLSTSRNTGDYKKESIENYSYELLTGEEATGQEKAVLDRLDLWRKVEI